MRETNWYTIVFALGMAVLVALVLTFLKETWRARQEANELLFNKTSILKSVMEVDKETDIESIFKEKVKGYVINHEGNQLSDSAELALDIDLAKQSKRTIEERQMPLFIYTNEEGLENYILATRGNGLWGWISAFVALGSDKNEIVGITFDHEAETPGLGAEIKDNPGFYNDFSGEKIFDDNGNFVSVNIKKGNNDPNNDDKNDHEIDAISGATITGDGVAEMLEEDLKDYVAYLKNTNN